MLHPAKYAVVGDPRNCAGRGTFTLNPVSVPALRSLAGLELKGDWSCPNCTLSDESPTHPEEGLSKARPCISYQVASLTSIDGPARISLFS
jgi:hypothetical protein